MGQAPPGHAYNSEGEGWPLIAGASDFAGLKPSPKKFTTLASKVSKPGDIILGIRATIGEKVIGDSRYCLGRGVAAIRPASDDLDARFLWHWLSSIAPKLAAKGKGATFKQVVKQDIGELQIELPTLADQQRIAEVLDRADDLCAMRRTAIGKLDSLVQSIFFEMFGDPASASLPWTRSTVGDVALRVTDGEHLTPKRESSGIKLLSARNVRDGYLELENVDYIGPQEYERIRRRCDPQPGDILVSCSGTIGRVAVVDVAEPLALVRSAALIKPNISLVTTDYLAVLLRTPALKELMLRSAKASSQANLFQGPIKELPVPLPPLALQQEFGKRFRSVKKLKGTCQAQLGQLDQLFASLHHHAFEGELWDNQVI